MVPRMYKTCQCYNLSPRDRRRYKMTPERAKEIIKEIYNTKWGWGSSQDVRVAQAVVNEYPDRAIAIWKKLAENLIAQTKPKAYVEAATYLRKVSQTLKKLNKEKDWQTYLNELKQKNIRKIRFIETLDSLDGKRIIEGLK